jgi:hypothetical protein
MKAIPLSLFSLALMTSVVPAQSGQGMTKEQAQQFILDEIKDGVKPAIIERNENSFKAADYDAIGPQDVASSPPASNQNGDSRDDQARQIIADQMKNGVARKIIDQNGAALKRGDYDAIDPTGSGDPAIESQGSSDGQKPSQPATNPGANGGSGSGANAKNDPPPKAEDDEADNYDDQASEEEREAEAMKNIRQDDENAEKLSHDSDDALNIPGNYDDAVKLFMQMQDLYDQFKDYQATANQDKQQQPQLDSNAGPGLPMHCKAIDAKALDAQYAAKKAAIAAGKPLRAEDPNAGQCVPCYDEAERGINKRRVGFEQLRIALNYTRKMATQGENALSGFGAAGGSLATMEAQAQIHKVDASLADFYAAYDGKYVEILAKLKGSLDDFSKCEVKFFNNPDWYNRYGFLYYQFMADKYQRN